MGDFLSTVCPERIVLREVRKRGSSTEHTTKAHGDSATAFLDHGT